MRYVLPKVTTSVTSYFLPKLVGLVHMISMCVDYSLSDSIIDNSFA